MKMVLDCFGKVVITPKAWNSIAVGTAHGAYVGLSSDPEGVAKSEPTIRTLFRVTLILYNDPVALPPAIQFVRFANLHQFLQKYLHILGWPSQHRAIATLNDRPLNQIRMLNHQRDNFIVAEFLLTETEFPVH
jgi:hypothetical protein